MRITHGIFCVILLSGCAAMGTQPAGGTFGDDLAFLRKHTDVLVLQSPGGR